MVMNVKLMGVVVGHIEDKVDHITMSQVSASLKAASPCNRMMYTYDYSIRVTAVLSSASGCGNTQRAMVLITKM